MVNFFNEDINFDLSIEQKQFLKTWITQCIENFSKHEGDINIIFASDEYLYQLNIKYLNHDYYTDIITFDYVNQNQINGDLFISIERVKENANIYHEPFERELYRVIIHGILHLIGFSDKTENQKQIMREKENFCLSKLDNLN